MDTKTKNEEDRLGGKHFDQRRAIGNAYAALLGQQNIQTFQAFTFEEAIDAQIERIEGADTTLRPNELKRVAHIEQELLRAAEEIRKLPPEQFLEKDEKHDV